VSESLVAVLIFGFAGLAIAPLAAAARSLELWFARREAERTHAE
jgi:hypothetical protein